MSLLFLDSFDTYVTADITQKWTQLASGPTHAPTVGAYGRRGTNGVRWSTSSASGGGQTLLVALHSPTASDTCIAGFAFTHGGGGFAGLDTAVITNPADNSTSGSPMLFYVRNIGTTRVCLKLNTDGTISAYNGAATLLGTTSTALTVDVTSYIEVKVKVHASTGTVDINLNGLSVLAATGLNTTGGGAGTGWNEIGIGHMSLGSAVATTWTYDDLYVADGAGSIWNGFKGDTAVSAVAISAEGTHTDSTPSTGTDREAMVDDATPDGDTTYNTLTAANEQDSFVVDNLPIAGADIFGVQINMAARRTDVGTGSLNGIARVSGTTYVGATPLGVTSSYSTVREVMEVDPATSAAWTEAAFNAAEFGYRKVS